MVNSPGRKSLYDSLVQKVQATNGKLPAYDQIDFTPEEKERFEKLSFIDDLVRRKMPILKLSDIYKLFSLKFPGDSQRQFYRLYDECQQFFGSTGIKSKNYQISIYVRWLEEAASVALKMHDVKAFKDCIAEAAKLLDLYSPEDTDKLLNETPRSFVIMMNVTLPDGQKQPKFVDLDRLNKLKPGEFNSYIEEVNNIEFPLDQMAIELEKNS